MSETYSNSTLTAFFDSRADADDAAGRLRDLGIADSAIRIVGDETRASDQTYERTETGADADKGFWASLGDFFFPDEDRAVYAEGLRRGGTLLTVSNIPADLYDRTLDILDDEGSVDIDTRAEDWRSEGWSNQTYGSSATAPALGDMTDRDLADRDLTSRDATGSTYSSGAAMGGATGLASDANSTAYGASSATSIDADARRDTLRGDRDEEVIPVVEEQLRIGKRDVNLGRVRVRSYVVEEPVNESVNLRNERVFVERRPTDRTLTGSEADFTDRVIEAEEHGEEAVVSKEARVKEEIGLRREAEERTENVSDTVRHTEVEIDDERAGDRLTGERKTADKI